MQAKNPKLTLLGAGPGDPELLSLKAARILGEADVVLYDALVHPAVLEHAPQAEKVFVGKRRGCNAFAQPAINELIVKYAKSHGHVVRLKGGDPFIFGRGSEEAEFVGQYGIETTVVPGMSSTTSVPTWSGIPLTKRGVSESFWVITGTTKLHELSTDIAVAAQSSATIVILMGMGKLSEIVSVFQAQNKGTTATAILQSGTLDDENIGIGTIDTIEDVVAKGGFGTPAIIIIGDVVEHRLDLRTRLETEEKIEALCGQPANRSF